MPTPVNATYVAVPPGNSTELELALVEKPVIVSLKAGNDIFRNYESGVITNCDRDEESSDDDSDSSEDLGEEYPLDHFALVVGYGQTIGGTDYWLVQNSFGSEWGEDGYVRILKQDIEPVPGVENNGTCNILAQPLYLTGLGVEGGDEGEPPLPFPTGCNITFTDVKDACTADVSFDALCICYNEIAVPWPTEADIGVLPPPCQSALGSWFSGYYGLPQESWTDGIYKGLPMIDQHYQKACGGGDGGAPPSANCDLTFSVMQTECTSDATFALTCPCYTELVQPYAN